MGQVIFLDISISNYSKISDSWLGWDLTGLVQPYF